MAEDGEARGRFITLTVEIVSAYLGHNQVPAAQLPELIRAVSAALHALDPAGRQMTEQERPKAAAAEVRRSITPEALISFEDGKPYKTLRRHLTVRGLTPEAYRVKWGLPADYPMMASAYAAARSKLALDAGLGRRRVELLADEPETGDEQMAAGAAPTTEPVFKETVVREPFEDDGEAL